MTGPKRTWTPADDTLIADYARQGLSARAAAQALGVTRNAVIGRADRQGIHFHAAPVIIRAATRETALMGWQTRRARWGYSGRVRA